MRHHHHHHHQQQPESIVVAIFVVLNQRTEILFQHFLKSVFKVIILSEINLEVKRFVESEKKLQQKFAFAGK